MSQVLYRVLLSFVLFSIQSFILCTTFPESCKISADEDEVKLFSNQRRTELDFRFISSQQSDDGVVLMKEFNRFMNDQITNLGRGFNDWRSVHSEFQGLEDGIRQVCRNYDEEYTNAFPYSCYSKENWCLMQEFVRAILAQLRTTEPGKSNWLKDWTGFFNPPVGGHWADTWHDEMKMACESFFNHPSLGSMTDIVRQNRDDLKAKIVDRVKYYVRTNSLEYLKAFVDKFSWVKEPLAEACRNEDGGFSCEIDDIFNAVKSMLRDTDTFEWDFSKPPPRTREVIAMLWLVIPSKIRPMFPSLTDDEVARERVQRFLQITFDNVVIKNEEQLEFLTSHSENLRERSEADCNGAHISELNGLECVFSNVSGHLIDLISAVKGDTWSARKTLDKRSGTLIGLMATKTKTYIEFTASQTREFVIDSFDRLYYYAKRNDIEGLDQYTKSMPAVESLERIPGRSCSEFFNDLKSRIPCMFENMLRETFIYINSQKRAPLNTKVISTDFDYKDLLKSAQLAAISTQIEAQTLEVKADLAEFVSQIKTFISEESGRRFAALEGYFQGLADFDERKANADIGFIAGRLTGFDDQIKELQPELETNLWSIINGSVLASAVDTIQRAGELVVKSSFACNPLDPDPGAVIDAVNELAQSIVTVMRSDTLRRLFTDVVDQTTSVASRMSENNAFIENVRTIVKDLPNQLENNEEFTKLTNDFLDKYTEYDPKVQSQEIAEMGTNWEAFIEEGCETLFAGGTAASAVIESIWANEGECLTTQAKISKLIEIFTEIYEYQFDLMETLATAVRAYQSKFFADKLNTNLRVIKEQDISEENDNVAVNFNEAMLNFFLIYRMHTFQIIAQYCNYLEFKNAGEMPSVCPNALETLEQRDISNLIAFNPAPCTPESFKFVDIPTSNSDEDDENGYINVTRLYTGEEVPFQIPNIDWMLKYKWITNADATDTAIYLSAFELFLRSEGSESSGKRRNLPTKKNGLPALSEGKLNAKIVKPVLFQTRRLGKIKTLKKYSSLVSHQVSENANLATNTIARSRRSRSQSDDIQFRVTAKYSAPLFTGEESARFVLQPYRRYIFSYQENPKSCRQDTIDNPYSSDLPEICPVSLTPVNNDVNPSVFSLWKVKLESSAFEKVPEGVEGQVLKAAVRLCKVTKPSTLQKKKKKKNKKKE